VATALVLVPTPASAQYQTTCGFILDPPVINVGGTVTIIGSRFGLEILVAGLEKL
jgi:hypothetical protein